MEEELLYSIIFPEDKDPNFINYGYFVGLNKRSVFKVMAALENSQLNALLARDFDHENAFFAKVFESEVDEFLKLVGNFNFKQINLNKQNIDEVKRIFGDDIHSVKKYKNACA